MSFLLDTNVISEPIRPAPEPKVLDWLAKTSEDQLFLSVITLAELRRGAERMPAGARRNRLEHWLDGELPARFARRLLPVDAETTDLWGVITARREALGRPIAMMDAFLFAAAQRHRLTLVTRNVADFRIGDLRLFNPWTDGV